MYGNYATICAGGFLTMKKWLLALVTALVLAACGDTDTADNTAKTNEEIIEEGTIGFEVLGETVEEASGVPAEEKEKILVTFNEYIESFNVEDIDRYAQTLSKNPKGFKYEQELDEVKKIFNQYSVINRKAEDVTIVKYSEEEAQVFSNMTADMVEEASDIEVTGEARTVVVLVKEEGNWKVTSVHAMDNQ